MYLRHFSMLFEFLFKLLFSCSKQTYSCKSWAPALLTDTDIFGWLSFSTFMWKYLHDTKNRIKNGFYFPCWLYRESLLSLFVKCCRPGLFKKELCLLKVIQGFLSRVSQSACVLSFLRTERLFTVFSLSIPIYFAILDVKTFIYIYECQDASSKDFSWGAWSSQMSQIQYKYHYVMPSK